MCEQMSGGGADWFFLFVKFAAVAVQLLAGYLLFRVGHEQLPGENAPSPIAFTVAFVLAAPLVVALMLRMALKALTERGYCIPGNADPDLLSVSVFVVVMIVLAVIFILLWTLAPRMVMAPLKNPRRVSMLSGLSVALAYAVQAGIQFGDGYADILKLPK